MGGNEDIRTCFVIMPFGLKKDTARGDRVQFDRVWSRIIYPAIDGLNKRGIRIRCDRSDKIERAGLIHERMIDLIADADVAVVDLTTANELRAKMQGRQLVNPGEVVSTSAGALESTHEVKRIYHAASVYGVVGEGFHAIAPVEQCITNALARVDWEARGLVETQDKAKAATGKHAADSILFPLLSAGTARADAIQSARRQLATAINYLRSRAKFTNVKRVYFIAGNETVLAALRVALAELGVIRPKAPRKKKAKGSVKPVKPAAAARVKRKLTTRRARA